MVSWVAQVVLLETWCRFCSRFKAFDAFHAMQKLVADP